jgi:diguanylate cyclase (GGDEF)-like protein
MSLLGEVERLQEELAQARTKLAEIEAKADIDPLLNILNRRGFERELRRALAYVKRYGTRAALIYLDLDGFKPINDAYGHAAGDAALKAVAQALLENVRASDTVARVGGDEFVVLLWNLDAADVAAKAAALERLVAGLEIPFGIKNLSVGVSAGSTVLEPLDEAAAVLVRADKAMYRRKAGRKFAPPGLERPTTRAASPSAARGEPASSKKQPRKTASRPSRPGRATPKGGPL